MSLTKTTYSMITGSPLSVVDFGAIGNGTTDDTAAIQLAVTAAYAQKRALYFPAGTYLMSSTITMGNNNTDKAKFCHFFGDGNNTIIYVSAPNVNPFYWQWNDIGVRIDGRILIEKMNFRGPDSFGSNTNSIALKFYMVQGITLRDCTFRGWYDAEHYIGCDIVSRYNVYSTVNFNAINTVASAAFPTGNFNSFNTYGGLIAGNTGTGVLYIGGISPCFFGTNFTTNGVSLSFSSNPASSATTVDPQIIGCYFEADVGTTIIFGGGSGIVIGGVIQGCNFIAASATALITISNYSNGLGRGIISNNTTDTSFIGSSEITQATSAQKIDFKNLNGTPIGDVTPSTGTFTTLSATGAASAGSISSTGGITTFSTLGIPTGGQTGAGFMMSSNTNLGIFYGTNAPTLSANQGSLYLRIDGSSTSTRLYVNTNGTTGWTAVTTVS